MKQALDRLGLELSDAQVERLSGFAELLRTRAIEIGAIGKRDRERIMERHVLDALRAAQHVRDTDRIGYDFGSGAGIPGVPLSIARPSCGFILVESRHWRAAFLEMVIAELELNARVERARVETMGVPADLIVARAFAPLARTWELAAPLLKPSGRLIFFAGGGMPDPEGTARAVAGGAVSVEVVPNLLDHGGPLVIMAPSA